MQVSKAVQKMGKKKVWAPSDNQEAVDRMRKRDKVQRGGGVKGAFRNIHGGGLDEADIYK